MSTEMPCYRVWIGIELASVAVEGIAQASNPLDADEIRAIMAQPEMQAVIDRDKDKTCPDWNLPLCPSCQLRAQAVARYRDGVFA